MTIQEALELFGPMAAIALGLLLLFRYVKPRLEQAETYKDDRIKKLEDTVGLLTKEKDEAKDVVIRAFGDISDAWQQLVTQIKALITTEIWAHDDKNEERTKKLLKSIEHTKDEIIGQLRKHIDDLSGIN